ncbi:MAG: hypothetical protein COT37_01490 [Parcubacteria group bacterium CG08_land_8_20_14_0_20_43_9]|nr:MAG: hypothetical protein COT37_01490 [Parcubacteria group bacterium CG08_land_8_20_14_0_20_43_9]
MSDYYKAKREDRRYSPGQPGVFKVSRSKIGLFMECPRCFYMDCRLGVSRPPGFPFTLNSAVDKLLKKEFDLHRVAETAHPLMEEYGIEAVPFQDKRIDEWRDTRRGIQHLHEPTNLLIMGAIDDVWVNPKGELHIVDYKATSKNGEITLDAPWQIGYKRQMEVYQWLFRKNEFKVSDTGYFVYCNGKTDTEAFDKKIEFEVSVIPYVGDDKWVEGALADIKECLEKDVIPEMAPDCDYCSYRKTAAHETYKFMKKK